MYEYERNRRDKPNAAKTANIINPDGSTASAILSDVRIN